MLVLVLLFLCPMNFIFFSINFLVLFVYNFACFFSHGGLIYHLFYQLLPRFLYFIFLVFCVISFSLKIKHSPVTLVHRWVCRAASSLLESLRKKQIKKDDLHHPWCIFKLFYFFRFFVNSILDGDISAAPQRVLS